MQDHHQRSLSTFLRLILSFLFWVVLWKAFGWGWGLSAALVSMATGTYTVHAVVPISLELRGLVELAVVVAGVIGSFQIFGWGWGLLVFVIALVVYGLNSRQLLGAMRR